jgi:hypothetical protein
MVDIVEPKLLWELLVPTIHSETGKPIRTRFHRVWDTKVRAISGGLTILQPAKGQWISMEGELFSERMIPVRIMCTWSEINKISDMTAAYYKQKAVMFYKLTQDVHIKHYTS